MSMTKPDCRERMPYYDDPFPVEAVECGEYTVDQVLCEDYVRVICSDKKIIQIRSDIISFIDTIMVLSRPNVRPADNLAECIHLVEPLASSDRVKIFCDWFNTHLKFENENASDYIREEYDRYHFLLNKKGKKKYLKLKDTLKVRSTELFTPNEKIDFECKMKKIQNKDVSTFTPDELNNTFNTVIMDEIKNILDPFTEVKRQTKYHRTLDELCKLVSVSTFLGLKFKNITPWHTRTDESIKENEKNLCFLYPCSQFGYFNIPQRIFCETSFELLLFHIVNHQIAIANTNTSVDLSPEWKVKCNSDIDSTSKLTCNTSTKNDLYNIILIYNYFQRKLYPTQTDTSKPVLLPQNHASLSFNINNNSTLQLFYKFYCLSKNKDNLDKELKQKSEITDDIYSFYRMFESQDYQQILDFQSYPKILNYLLTILAYNSSEGKSQRDYRIAYMDNPDPQKKYKDGVSGELLTTLKQYDDPHISGPPPYKQYGGPLDKGLIEHFMP
jgi:hypothetical protein